MGIAIDKQGNYDFWYTNPRTGKRTKKRILRADKTPPKDIKEAERLIQEFRRGIEELDGIKTRERAVLELAQARQLIASKTHRISDLLAMFEKSSAFPASADRQKYARLVLYRFMNWCGTNGIEGLADLTPAQAKEYMDKELATLASDTKRKHQTLLQTAYKAVAKEIGLSSNPWDDVKKPALKHISRQNYTAEQVEKICCCFESWFTDESENVYVPANSEQLYVGFILGLYAGCRLKDACLMKWQNVSLEKGTITYTPAKTSETSGATVTLPILEGREKEWLRKAQEWKDESGYICPKLAELYKHSNVTVSRQYIKCFELATGLKNRFEADGEKSRSLYGFHSLRHTCASILANAGVDIATIAGLVGHSSTAITQIYTHISMEHQAEEMKRAFGKGAQTRQEINKLLDKMSEKQLKQVLQYLKFM